MIVPGFIVNRMYQKGSLRKIKDGNYSFRFKPGVGKGTTTLTAPGCVTLKNPLSNLDLISPPDLYVDDRRIPIKDIQLLIDGEPIEGYDEEMASRGEEQSRDFDNTTTYEVKFKTTLANGRHDFKVIARAEQFKELIANFTDFIGEDHPLTFFEKISRFLLGDKTPERGSPADGSITKTAFYILKDKRPDPDFGRVQVALACKEPDRVPLLELFADQEVKEAFLKRPVTTGADEVEFHLAVAYDYVPIMVPFLGPRKMEVIDSHRSSYKDELQERAWVHESDGIIKSMEDFEAFEWNEITDDLFGDFEDVSKTIPPEMKIIGSVSAVFETVTQAMGLEAFSLNLYDRPELIEAMFQKSGELVAQCIERLLQFEKVGAIWITDDLAYHQGPIISPKMLRKFVFPWYEKFVAMVHEKGLPIILHSCGNTEPLFEDIISAGFDALHPLEANAVDIVEAKKKIGNRICLVGNIDLSYMLTRGTVEEIEEDVKKHIREIGPGGGYCLSSSNSITNYVPLENFIAMNRACLKYGKYPISI